jgi:hypothetical protein
MNSKVNSKVNRRLDTTDWSPIDRQLLTSIQNVKTERRQSKAYFFGENRDDWLDALQYGLLFGTPEEIFRIQVQARNEAEKEGRPYTPVFWHCALGAEPILTLWRIE